MTESEILIRLADFDWSRAQKKDFIDILNSIAADADEANKTLTEKVTTLETALQTANGKISNLEERVQALESVGEE